MSEPKPCSSVAVPKKGRGASRCRASSTSFHRVERLKSTKCETGNLVRILKERATADDQATGSDPKNVHPSFTAAKFFLHYCYVIVCDVGGQNLLGAVECNAPGSGELQTKIRKQ